MSRYGIRICCFDSTRDLTGKARTYEAIKARVLEVGRFSIFDVGRRDAAKFKRLEHDPEIETFRDGLSYPWIGVRKREKAEAES